MESGKLFPGGIVTEGSAGSTAISLATVAPAYGCKCHVVIPDDAAIEKVFYLSNTLMIYIRLYSLYIYSNLYLVGLIFSLKSLKPSELLLRG